MPKQSELLEQLITEVKSLKEAILGSLPQPLTGGLKDTVLAVEPTPAPPKQEYPIPLEYQGIVGQILNKDFGIRIEPQPDAPAFIFTVVVPDKYSPMTPAQRQTQKEDIRPKVIQFSDGVNGVRLWAEKVYNNFSPEVQARIAADRVIP